VINYARAVLIGWRMNLPNVSSTSSTLLPAERRFRSHNELDQETLASNYLLT
jgi:hypothetical protein